MTIHDIPRKPQGFIGISTDLMNGCSDNLGAFVADGGNHFTDYGIYPGSQFIVDLDKPFLDGHVSCYSKKQSDRQPELRLSLFPLEEQGYRHLGRVVLTIRNFEGPAYENVVTEVH